MNIEPQDVEPYGCEPGDPLAGVAFQRHWETRAFELGGASYAAPAQRLEDFLAGLRYPLDIVRRYAPQS